MKNTLKGLLQANPLSDKELKTLKMLLYIHLVIKNNNFLF